MINETDYESVAKRLKNGESVHLYYCSRMKCERCNDECCLTTDKKYSVNPYFHVIARENADKTGIEYEVVQDEVSD